VEKDAIRATAQRSEASPGFEELAARQGVRPVTEFDAILGHPSAEDELIEEFSAMLREWRRETASTSRQ
jgi:hypothetical protein